MKEKPLPKEIDGKAQTINELLKGRSYSIDFYQREYQWQEKQIRELINDLASTFLENYIAGHKRPEVKRYSHYFLGSVIISAKDGENYIIDGQQRITSLTLVLIFLNNLQRNRPDAVPISDLIFSEPYGEKAFNLNVEDRVASMEALFAGENSFDTTNESMSARNVVERYQDIREAFPPSLRDEALPLFIDWLCHNVHVVVITAYSDEDAYTIFESMNDRGLPLKPADMLKGHLLSRIVDAGQQRKANDRWKALMLSLSEAGGSEESGADCLKAWLRSQYAEKIRERKGGAKSEDWDLIGTEFHRWVGERSDYLKLTTSDSVFEFIHEDFAYYAAHYERLIKLAQKRAPELPEVRYVAVQGFTLQYQILLAPLKPKDPEEVARKKMRLVATYLDILIARRLLNYRAIDYSTMQYAMFQLTKRLRRLDAEPLCAALHEELDKEQEVIGSRPDFGMTPGKGNRRQIHRLLAQITDWLETNSELPGRYEEYLTAQGKQGFEVEHIWSDKAERHTDEFQHASDFDTYRNRLGDLLLLPKTFNASYGDKPYEDKHPHYFGQNILARSLHPKCYEHNPGFMRFLAATQLPFRAHEQFKKADLDERQKLILAVAQRVWDAARLDQILAA
jgi:hypothetical protein